MKKLNIATLLCGLILFITSCGGSTTPTSVDEGETTSKSVAIGKQVWTTKNLDVSKFRNGEAITLAKTNAEWELAGKNKQAAWCYNEYDSANGAKYGKLYNWYAVNDPRGLAPNGYHIPTVEEWQIFTNTIGTDIKMKSKSGWKTYGANANYINNNYNTSGFDALPGGYRGGGIGTSARWWASSERNSFDAYHLALIDQDVSFKQSSKRAGLSVRCIKD